MATQTAPDTTSPASEFHFVSSDGRRKLSIARASWLGYCFACTLTMLPTLGLACDLSERKACEKRIVDLVSYRSEAIEHAFGDLSAALPDELRVRFVTSQDP